MQFAQLQKNPAFALVAGIWPQQPRMKTCGASYGMHAPMNTISQAQIVAYPHGQNQQLISNYLGVVWRRLLQRRGDEEGLGVPLPQRSSIRPGASRIALSLPNVDRGQACLITGFSGSNLTDVIYLSPL